MLRPHAGLVPSEATIEQIANHQILNAIGPYSAWFYVPTRREEQRLAYDASLQGHKALVIQYKRFSATGRVGLSKKQHQTLLANFPRGASPYVFYGVSTHPTYRTLQQQFSAGAGFFFGLGAVFVDAHDIPIGTPSFSVTGGHCPPGVTTRRSPIANRAYCLVCLVGGFLSCSIGARPEPEAAMVGAERVLLAHLNILWARV